MLGNWLFHDVFEALPEWYSYQLATNFDTLENALFTCVEVSLSAWWTEIMYRTIYVTSWWASIYYIALVVVRGGARGEPRRTAVVAHTGLLLLHARTGFKFLLYVDSNERHNQQFQRVRSRAGSRCPLVVLLPCLVRAGASVFGMHIVRFFVSNNSGLVTVTIWSVSLPAY